MKIAIVAATEIEIACLKSTQIETPHELSFHIHGIGMMMSMFHLQYIIQTKPDFIIQCGIAGSYTNQLALGEVVVVKSECLGDTGSQDHEHFLDLFDLEFLQENTFPFNNKRLLNPHLGAIQHWKKVNALTVNAGSGNQTTIDSRVSKYHPEIESMEGACLHYACLHHHIPFIQFRGISNYVEPRNKANWKIQEAVTNVQLAVIQFLNDFK